MPDSWLGDRCTHAHIFLVGKERALDILAAHAHCQPACPRQEAARKYAETFVPAPSGR